MGSSVAPDGLRVGARHMGGIRRRWQAGNDRRYMNDRRHMTGNLPVLFRRAHGAAAAGADTGAARLLRHPAEMEFVRAPGRMTACALAFIAGTCRDSLDWSER